MEKCQFCNTISNETPMFEVIDILKKRCVSWLDTIDNASPELDKVCKFLDKDIGYGCGHFKEINDYLLKIGEKEIEW